MIKMPKTLFGFPVKIDWRCPPDKIYLRSASPSNPKKKEWVFPHPMRLTSTFKAQLKEMKNKLYDKNKKE